MLICFHGLDRPDSSELRASARAAHLDHRSRQRDLVGGPLLDADGNVCGTLIVFEASDLAAATADMNDDPYIAVGLFEHTSLTEFAGTLDLNR